MFNKQQNGSDITTSTIFLTTNSIGDILLLSDEKGNQIARYDYDPYGNITRTQVTTTTLLSNLSFNTILAYAQPLRYASYFYDTQTNLYYLSQRYYDPETYQFTSKDPAKADGEESAYQYCSGEPVNKVDPSGEWDCSLHYKMSYRAALKLGFRKWVAKIIAFGSWVIDWTTNPIYHFNPQARWLAALWFSNTVLKAYRGDVIKASLCLGYALHLIQDSYAHIGPFWKHKSKWDNPKWKPYRYQKAKRATRRLLRLFKRSLPKWLRKAYCY